MLINYHFMTKSELHAWSTNLFLASQQFFVRTFLNLPLTIPRFNMISPATSKHTGPEINAYAWLAKGVAAVATVFCLVLPGSFLSCFTIIVFGLSIKYTQPHTNLSYPKESFLNLK